MDVTPIMRTCDLKMFIYRPLVEQKILTLICSHVRITSWRNLTFADTNKRQKKKKAAELYFPPPTISAEIAMSRT